MTSYHREFPDRNAPITTLFAATVMGGGAAAVMFAWQDSVELMCSTFFIVAYTVGAWLQFKALRHYTAEALGELRRHPINRPDRRAIRLIGTLRFWWSIVFGTVIVITSAWYAGLRDLYGLAWVATGWTLIAFLLNYEMTILFPTTRCRKCDYQLMPQLDPKDPEQIVQCPECGSKWTKSELFLTRVVTAEAPDQSTGRGLHPSFSEAA
ncbi:MAG: hypothetical protein ACF8PN_00765 [Phycisphaerales bacterium]